MSSHIVLDHDGIRELDAPPTDLQVAATLDVTTIDGRRVTFHIGDGALHILAGEHIVQTFGPTYWATVTGEAVQVKGDEGYRPSRG